MPLRTGCANSKNSDTMKTSTGSPVGSPIVARLPKARANAWIQAVRQEEEHDRQHRQQDDRAPDVPQHVMADLVARDGLHFVERRTLERDVRDGDAGRAPRPETLAVKLFDWREPS